MAHYLIDKGAFKIIEERTQPPADPHLVISAELAVQPIEALDIVEEIDGESVRQVAVLNEQKLKAHEQAKASREQADAAKRQAKDKARADFMAADISKANTIAELRAVLKLFQDAMKD